MVMAHLVVEGEDAVLLGVGLALTLPQTTQVPCTRARCLDNDDSYTNN